MIVGTCFGMDNNASKGLREFGEEMSVRETELEEYQPRDAALLPRIPLLHLRHAQIRWYNWLAAQWDKTSEVPFPDLERLWTAMDNQELWDPTFPAGYTRSPNAAYGGGMISRPTHGTNPSAQWTPSETTSTPLVTSTAPVAPKKAKPASRGGGRGGGTTPGHQGGGPGGGSMGEEEQPNAIAYNNDYVEGIDGNYLVITLFSLW